MSLVAAFLGPRADDLFSSIAAFADARELEALDVAEGQEKSRQAIEMAIANALRHKKNPGSRIALIKGDAGSGKSHVLTTMLKRAASNASGEVYPAVLQLTAPVKQDEYENWLLDATVRQLSARHFADDSNHSPLRRLAGRLLSRMPLAEQDDYVRLIDDADDDAQVKLAVPSGRHIGRTLWRLAGRLLSRMPLAEQDDYVRLIDDDDGQIKLAARFGRRIRREALELLSEEPPNGGFIAVVLLAGFGDSSALKYLSQGIIDNRIAALGLDEIKTQHQRIEVLKGLGLCAQIAGASLALGFDQVENTVRLGSEGLFVHTLTQAVRIAESVFNAAVIVAVLGVEYDDIVAGKRKAIGLAVADRDRIEREAPFGVRLDRGTPDFLRKVIARRLAVLRERSSLPQEPGSLTPLPPWLLPRIDQARSVRYALREVAMFRERAIALGRIPTQPEYEGACNFAPIASPPLEQERDFAKEWADFRDLSPATRIRLLDTKKAPLLAWWAREASRENIASEPVDVAVSSLADEFSTQVIEVVFKANGATLERRQLALCEAPNRSNRLLHQVERFLNSATGIPAVLRTNGFPKGRQSQVAPALRKLESLSGLQLDLSETEWHNLQRAKDFADKVEGAPDFLAWRRDQQWLLNWLSPLRPIVAPPETVAIPLSTHFLGHASAPTTPNGGPVSALTDDVQAEAPSEAAPGAFPVRIGTSFEGPEVVWAPYQQAPNHLNNFGMLVTGDAGSGKTQTIRVLIDAACREGLAVTIFDFKADYCDPGFTEPLGIEVVDVRALGLPFNPLQPPPRGASGVQPIEHAYELASVLSRVFKLGAIQEGLLRNAIASVYESKGISPQEWTDPASVSWPSFDLVLDVLRGEKRAAALVTKLGLLSELGLFPSIVDPTRSFETFINKRVCLKLSDLPTDEVKSAVAEIIIIQLHGYALRGDQPRRLKRLLVFDEAHRVRESQRLESLAREGRAFGVGIVIGTQFPGDIPEALAGNLATQLFLMNNRAAHRKLVVSQLLGSSSGSQGKAMLEQIGRLQPLEGVFVNAHYCGGVFVKVTPHYARTGAVKS